MKKLFLIGLLGILMSGCVSQAPKRDLYATMYQDLPKSVLVLPAINHSTAADAPNLYASTVAQPLANAGYYVMSTEITQRFLQNEGLVDGEQLLSVPVQKFQQIFGADAVLYVTIEKWDTNYFIIGGNVTVGISYVLKSTKTGNVLWTYANQIVMDTSGDSNNGGGLLGALIATAITTSTQDYVPIARNINYMALGTIPFGSYHKDHGKDHDQLVNVPSEQAVTAKR